MTRPECLTEANRMTGGKRQNDYGKPEDNFKRIANMWSAYLHTDVNEVDVCMMMCLLKVARVKGSISRPTDDCFVDICGYSACAAEINSAISIEENDHGKS